MVLEVVIGIACAAGVAFAIWHGTRGKGGNGPTPTKTMALTDEQQKALDEQVKASKG